MRIRNRLTRTFFVCVLAQAALLAPPAAQAQSNSPQAIEAARKYRAEQARGERPAPQRADTAETAPRQPRPFSSGANPNADPSLSLKSCLDNVGINPVARDRCMRRHCAGRWGQGDCPAGGDLMSRQGANTRTPLGRCLREAGANPFKRDACGWRHCNRRWDAPECAAIRPRDTPLAQ